MYNKLNRIPMSTNVFLHDFWEFDKHQFTVLKDGSIIGNKCDYDFLYGEVMLAEVIYDVKHQVEQFDYISKNIGFYFEKEQIINDNDFMKTTNEHETYCVLIQMETLIGLLNVGLPHYYAFVNVEKKHIMKLLNNLEKEFSIEYIYLYKQSDAKTIKDSDLVFWKLTHQS